MTLVSGFFLLGFLLLSASRAEAQTNWVSADEAKTRLAQQIVDVYHPVIQQGTPGANYDNALRHAVFYKAIYQLIVDGSTVADAVTKGFETFSTAADPALQAGSKSGSQPGSNPLMKDAVDLLTD